MKKIIVFLFSIVGLVSLLNFNLTAIIKSGETITNCSTAYDKIKGADGGSVSSDPKFNGNKYVLMYLSNGGNGSMENSNISLLSTEEYTILEKDTTLYANFVINDTVQILIILIILLVISDFIILFMTLYILWRKKDKKSLKFLVPIFRKINQRLYKTKLNCVELELEEEYKKVK